MQTMLGKIMETKTKGGKGMKSKKLSALKKEYRQLYEQMANLDQEWIRKHEELNGRIMEIESTVNYDEELTDSVPRELTNKTCWDCLTLGDYSVDEDKEAKA
tara:strand:+ start:568 stop:873 length:306 start_codon:yes stop_codon:yes gene_type:complete